MQIHEYCRARGLTTTEAFTVAWTYSFEEEPDMLLIEGQVRQFQRFGRLPFYVEEFLRDANHLQ